MVDRFQCMGKIYSKEFKTQEISVIDFNDSGRVADRESGIEIVLELDDIVLHSLDNISRALLVGLEAVNKLKGLCVGVSLACLIDLLGRLLP